MPSQRKGCKSRKATKQKKARQARRHREARHTRQMRRYDRSLQDLQTARPSSDRTNGQEIDVAYPVVDQKHRKELMAEPPAWLVARFRRFPDLPLELREMIWEECIPSRLVIPDLLFVYKFYLHEYVLDSQRRPPIISQVCHEARRIALRHGSRITLATWCTPWTIWSRRIRYGKADETAWFDTRRDTLLLSRSQSREQTHGPDVWMDMSDEAIAAIIASGRLGCMRSDRSHIDDDFATDMVGSEWLQGADVVHVVGRYHLLARIPVAVRTGLFGLFGENRAILVDLDDSETLRTLKRLRTGDAYGDVRFQGRSSPVEAPEHFRDIKEVPEICREQIPQHDKAWWLFDKFCNKKTPGSGDVTYPGFERYCQGSPRFRLAVLVVLCPDSQEERSRLLQKPLNDIVRSLFSDIRPLYVPRGRL